MATTPRGLSAGAILSGPAEVAVTIVDDDPRPSVSISGVQIAEGNVGTTDAAFTVQLSNPTIEAVSVNYATADGTAIAGSDYVATSGTLLFPPLATTALVKVQVNGDYVVEPNETLRVNLSNAVNAWSINVPSALGTILNDDGPGKLQFAAPNVSVAEGGGSALVTVNRVSGLTGTVAVNYSTSDGTAKSGSDYTAASGTLTFLQGEASKTFSVPITDDSLDEDNETIALTLSSPAGGATLGVPVTASLAVTDNDPTPTLSVGDVTVSEGNSGMTTAVFNVSLSAPSGRPVTISYVTADGTATVADGDYQSASGSLTFKPGETSAQISVLVVGDTKDESEESFTLNLSNPGNATLARAQGTGTISNDDGGGVRFSQSSYQIPENGTTAQRSVTVVRGGDVSQPASVEYRSSDSAEGADCAAPSNGVASQRCDYAAMGGTLQFAAGESERQIVLLIVDDTYQELSETFTVTLTNAVGASLGTPAAAAIVIADNDPAGQPNPIDGPSFFTRQQYLDFLVREPDSGGMQFYLNILSGCAASDVECNKYTRGALSANFFRSPEFQQKGSFVMYLYMVSLGQRPATVAELSDASKIDRPHYSEFIADLQTVSDPADDKAIVSAKKDALTATWLRRTEVAQRLPAMLTNSQFVQKLSDTAGVTLSNQATLVAALNAGTMTRAQVLRAFAESPEVDAKFYKQAFVTMEYFGYLRRDPEPCWNSSDPAGCGYIFHNARFQLSADEDFLENTIVRGFIESPEYRSRFGSK
ncbi:MAG: Calx-beta domain-containing protein [Pyrinomonadaceae bacterium]